jgi:hypothetical protein
MKKFAVLCVAVAVIPLTGSAAASGQAKATENISLVARGFLTGSYDSDVGFRAKQASLILTGNNRKLAFKLWANFANNPAVREAVIKCRLWHSLRDTAREDQTRWLFGADAGKFSNALDYFLPPPELERTMHAPLEPFIYNL